MNSKRNLTKQDYKSKFNQTAPPETKNKKGFSMLSKKSNYHLHEISSPWLDKKYGNQIKEQFQLAKENPPVDWGPYFTPLPIFKEIYDLGGEEILYRGLAQLAPMFPLTTYHGDIAVWTSPPPSGLGNAIFIVIGQGSNNRLRLVGGNWFTEPKKRIGIKLSGKEFFNKFDQSIDYDKFQLVKDTVEFSIKDSDLHNLLELSAQCELFHTMPIYIVLLGKSDSQSMFQSCPAVIEGVRPTNMSFEFLGEIL
jgi:hypothetical protein